MYTILDQVKWEESQSLLANMELEITKIKSFAATMDSSDMITKQSKVIGLANGDKLNQALFLLFVQKRS